MIPLRITCRRGGDPMAETLTENMNPWLFTSYLHAGDNTITVAGVPYGIDPNTLPTLLSGKVPATLGKQIWNSQGKETLNEFSRQVHMIGRAREMMQTGALSAALRPLIESGAVPAEILYKLCEQNMPAKAQKLLRHGLISEELMQRITKGELPADALPELSRAFLLETARHLCIAGEISDEILDAVQSGNIDPYYIRVIRSHYRQMLHSEERAALFTSGGGADIDDCNAPAWVETMAAKTGTLPHTDARIEQLNEALTWLPVEEAAVIHSLFYEHLTIETIAQQTGIPSSTVRYRRDNALDRLKWLMESLPADK